MRSLLLYVVCIALSTSLFGQGVSFTDLDEALKEPESVRSLYLGNQTKYENSKELPKGIAKCKNLNKIFFGWHKNFDLPKLFELLSQLPKLDTLEMYACDLKRIPDEVGLLTGLKYLKLSLNHITEISPEIKGLRSLEYMDLSSNELESLPDEIGQLRNLKELTLAQNEIVQLPNSICDLLNLIELNVGWNKLTSLPEDIDKLRSLRMISFLGNRFQYIPESIGRLNVDELYFGGHQNKLLQFPYEIFQIRTLKRLGVFQIKIDSFPPEFGGLVNLEKIILEDLVDFNWSSALLNMSQLPALKSVSLDVERRGEIPEEITALKQITELTLKGGARSFRTMQYVSRLNNLTRLQFDLYSDSILPSEMGRLLNLQYLKLGRSKLMSLPREIGDLVRLQELEISQDWGCRSAMIIPGEIGGLRSLRVMDFSRCNVEEFPHEIGCLSSLEELIVWDGGLTFLPGSIGDMHKLERLSLAGNELKNLPSELFNLKCLRVLNISDNELAELDNGVCALTNLEELDLGGNVRLEVLPECMGRLSKLIYLNLSNTRITELPVSLSELFQLERIELCETLIKNPRKLDRLYPGRIDWQWNCRNLEKSLMDFGALYGMESTKLIGSGDTLILRYSYFYNEPGVIDEEYSETITIKLPRKEVRNNKKFTIPDPNVEVAITFSSIWDFNSDYRDLNGQILILEVRDNLVKLSVSLSGKYNEREEAREIVNKTLEYKR